MRHYTCDLCKKPMKIEVGSDKLGAPLGLMSATKGLDAGVLAAGLSINLPVVQGHIAKCREFHLCWPCVEALDHWVKEQQNKSVDTVPSPV